MERRNEEKMSIILDHVNHIYEAGTAMEYAALKDICLTIPEGQFIGLIGHTGSGKSTLAKVLMGIEKADEGQIILDGEDITAYDINHRANAGIGYAFQQPPRFKGMTVILITHNSAIAPMADRVIKIKNGRVADMVRNPYPVPVETIEW